MQFVKCRFQSNSTRSYTYQWPGNDLKVGDIVDVETDRGEVSVEVVALLEESDHPSPREIIRKLAPPVPLDDEQGRELLDKIAAGADPSMGPIGDGQ